MPQGVRADCLADVNLLRAEPGVFGRVASDPTVSRLIDTLAGDADHALAAIVSARAQARAQVWSLAGEDAPDHGADASAPLIIDLDATLVTSYSEKEQAAPTFKTWLRVPPVVRVRRSRPGRHGGALHLMLRPGNAGSNTGDALHPHQEGVGATARTHPRDSAGSEGPDPNRCGRGDPRFPLLVDQTVLVAARRVSAIAGKSTFLYEFCHVRGVIGSL